MSTLTDLEDYYKHLLIIQYANKQRARATIAVWVDCMTGDGILTQFPEAFNIDTAIGAQLDAIGLVLGVERHGLGDEKYRIILKFAILKNNTGVTMKEIDDALYEYFGNRIVANNNQNMSITYIFNNDLADLIPVIVNENLLPAPIGIGVQALTSVDPSKPYFGFKRGDIETNAVGFSTAGDKQSAIWISSDDIYQ